MQARKFVLSLAACVALAQEQAVVLNADINVSIDVNSSVDANISDKNATNEVPILVDAAWARHENNITTAGGGVVASGNGYFLSSDKLVYDHNTSTAEAFGNVFALDGSQSYMTCDYAKILTDKKVGYFKPFFGKNMQDNMWTASKDADAKDGYYYLKGAISSACSVDDPDWYISYRSGTIDKTQQWMHLYGATLNIADIPVFYSPYMAFSFDKSRHSGLLRPTVAASSTDGFVYAQPIYFVTSPDAPWDAQLTPQVRTKRGVGADLALRFIDSPVSNGALKLGYFKDQASYQQRYDLKNDTHYGGTLLYNRKRVFAPENSEFKDGLYVNVNYLNDIDYTNLQYADILDPIAPNVTTQSTINYFVQNQKNFVGLYSNYFINTATLNNNATLQLLPRAQYHRTLDTILDSNFFYSGDYKVSRYSRLVGLNATQQQFNIPLGFYQSFLDDIFQVRIGTNFYSNSANFTNQAGTGQNLPYYSYSTNAYNAQLATTLMRGFEDFTHTVDLAFTYTKPGYKAQNYLPVSSTWNDLTSQIILSSAVETENSYARLVQFFYDSNSKPMISHYLAFRAYHSAPNMPSNLSAIENDLIYYAADNVQIENDIFIRPNDSKVLSSTVTAHLIQDDWKASISQIFNTQTQIISPNNTQTLSAAANFWEAKLGFRITRYGFIEGGYAYDVQAGAQRGWYAQYGEKKPCIGYNLGIKSQILPMLTSSSSSSMYNLVVYFNINLASLGGLGQQYAIKSYQQ